MKSLLLLVGMLALAIVPANAGVHVSFGGGSFHGSFSSGFSGSGFSGGRYCYSGNCYRSNRCGFGYPCYGYGGYGYYGGYSPYYDTGYDAASYGPPGEPIPAPEPMPAVQAPAPAATAPAPAPAPMAFGIDVNGFVHSPYSDSIFKVSGVRNAQMVYDPVTGKPFLVR